MGWDVAQLVRASDRRIDRTACIDICAYDKDPVVYVRVQWVMATQTYPAHTISDKNNKLAD